MTIICYYALIGAAHWATPEQILAAIELAMEDVNNGDLSVDLLRTVMHVLLSPERRAAHDRMHRLDCGMCPRWFNLAPDSPLADKASLSRSFSEQQPDASLWVKVPCPLRSLVAKRQRKGRRTAPRPLWEAADTKRHAAAKKVLVLRADGATTVDAIYGRMGWAVGAMGGDRRRQVTSQEQR
ncbi:hypothetical protein BZA05DRAFT_421981 [Tricharina praecox]|uniref:uncharacterized protein n=1 Tax=Tricharina praecox TaxID=43433 RepID=UPI00221FF21C|nr:uncharacterized protein BZA05DRAFT_421981 [Tricharina praecox]KAI5844214.1 hypothetical protein BZA05DRAFT_421981 [Tricharina praecox]